MRRVRREIPRQNYRGPSVPTTFDDSTRSFQLLEYNGSIEPAHCIQPHLVRSRSAGAYLCRKLDDVRPIEMGNGFAVLLPGQLPALQNSGTISEESHFTKNTFDLFPYYGVRSLQTLNKNEALENSTMTAVETYMTAQHPVRHKSIRIDDLDIFYREAGLPTAPVILLLHGFPTSSNMFRRLIPRLSGSFRLVAPDYPGYGQSSMPDHKSFAYTFDKYSEIVDKLVESLGINKYSLYLMDYGAPVGYRLALRHPERVQGLIVQNGNAYEEGLLEFWDPIKKYWADPTPENRAAIYFLVDPKSTRWQYENGVSDTSLLDPTTWLVDQVGLDRPGNRDIQMDLMHDYGTNVPLYPDFQAFFRKYQPPTLIVWGKNDFIFPAAGAAPYPRDLKNVETHLLDTGHFALETHGEEIASRIEEFFLKQKSFR